MKPGERRGPQPEQSLERERLENIERRIHLYAGVLAKFDTLAEIINVDIDGTITSSKEKVQFQTASGQAHGEKFDRLMEEGLTEAEKTIQQLKKQPGIIDCVTAFGAVLVTFDSSKTGFPPVLQRIIGTTSRGATTRGFYKTYEAPPLGLIGIDINQKKRADGVSASTSLTHELRHHLRSLSDILLANDITTPFVSAPIRHDHQKYAEEKQGRKFRADFERLTADQANYEAILGRKLPSPSDARALHRQTENISAQRSYLDELHSSFLQKKSEWFARDGRVYSNRSEGKHHELVGDEPADIEAAKRLSCYLSGFYAAEQMHQVLRRETPEKRDIILATKPKGGAEFFRNFEQHFTLVGAHFGVARAVVQAEKFAREGWQHLLTNDFVKAHIPKYLEYLSAHNFIHEPPNGTSIKDFLLA